MFRSQLTPPIRLIIRLYCRSKLQSQKIIPTSAADNYKLVEALVAHMSEIDDELRMLHARTANLVTCILLWPEINKKEVAENSSKMVFNAHKIYDSELRYLGRGLYPVISILNHSCSPNSFLVFEGKLAVVRAVQHIPNGAEVLTSYIDLVGSTLAQQKALKERYLFNCTCPRCIEAGHYNDIQERAVLEGYRCKDDKCVGLLLHDSACKEAIAVYKEIETLQRHLCHPFCIKLLPTWKGIIQNSMKLEDWRQALAYSRLTVPVYQRVYPVCHPSLGLQYYTCGKLEGLLGEMENAVTSLTKAWNMLKITHGKTTPFMKNLFSMLQEIRLEARFE